MAPKIALQPGNRVWIRRHRGFALPVNSAYCPHVFRITAAHVGEEVVADERVEGTGRRRCGGVGARGPGSPATRQTVDARRFAAYQPLRHTTCHAYLMYGSTRIRCSKAEGIDMHFAALATGTLAIVLLTGCTTGSEPLVAETPQPVASIAPAAFKVFGLPTVAELEISAEQTNEEIAQDLVEAFSDWSMSGASREMYDLQFEGENGYLGLSEYVAKVMDQSDPVFEEALFGSNASNPQFQESIEFAELRHSQVLKAHYQTYGTQNLAPYVTAEEFVSLQNVVERDDGTITMYIDTVVTDNGDKNIVDGTSTGKHIRANYVIRKVDGVVKIVEPPSYVGQ